MSNEVIIAETTLVEQPVGVLHVTPVFIQPVSVVGPVVITQPIAIADTAGNPLTSTSGSLDVNITNGTPITVTGTFTFAPSLTATTTAILVTTVPTVLLGTNAVRKGFAVQNQDQVCFIKLDSTASTVLYGYELPKKGILEIENYCGPVTAVTASGSVTVMVTEKI